MTAKNYPVYQKDSAYNTNKRFDDGVFEQLALKLTNGGQKITSFAFTFTQKGVYVFGDAANPAAQTIVVVDASKQEGFYPLTKNNLQKLGVTPVPPELQNLPDGLQFISVSFFVVAFALLALQDIIFMQLAKREGLSKKGKSTKLKQVNALETKEGILAYIDDLNMLIKQNLEDVKEKLAEAKKNPRDQKKLHDLIKKRVNVLNEFRDGTADDLDSVIDLSKYLIDNLRFADGRSLRDIHRDDLLQKKLRDDESDEEEYDTETGTETEENKE